MSNEEICKYLTAFLYEVEPSVVEVKKGFFNYETEYVSKESGNLIDTKIKIKGNRLIYGNKDGRWRNSKRDSIVTYKLFGSKIKIKEQFKTGGSLVKEFIKSK